MRFPSRGVVCSVRGRDFTSSRPKGQLDLMEAKFAEEHEISIGPRLGPGEHDAKEGRALNQLIRLCDQHIEHEAGSLQIEHLIAERGLEGAKAVATPGVVCTFKELEEDNELAHDLHTAFRGVAARGNYPAADRVDG